MRALGALSRLSSERLCQPGHPAAQGASQVAGPTRQRALFWIDHPTVYADGAASDAWAIGLLAHEILTLHHPFVGTSLAVLMQRILRCEYDEGRLAAVPYPDELKAVAGRNGLLHVDASMRLTLSELSAEPAQ